MIILLEIPMPTCPKEEKSTQNFNFLALIILFKRGRKNFKWGSNF